MKNRVLSIALALFTIFASCPFPAYAAAFPEPGNYRLLELLPLEVSLSFPEYTLSAECAFSPRMAESGIIDSVCQDIQKTTMEVIKGKTTDYDKAQALCEWIYDNINYDYSLDSPSRYALKTFTGKAAVCDGYAKLAVLMMYFADIPCAYIAGMDQTGTGGHAWCAALINNKWVYFDPTWGNFDIPYNAHKSVHHWTLKEGYYKISSAFSALDGITIESDAKCYLPEYITEITLSNEYNYPITFIEGEGVERVTVTDDFLLDSVQDYSFPNLREIELMPGVKALPEIPFIMNSDLRKIIIPESVTSVGENAFIFCHNLVICGYEGSYAEIYAKTKEIPFENMAQKHSSIVSIVPNLDSASSWARDGITRAISEGYVPYDIQDKYQTTITRGEFCRMAVKWLEHRLGKNIDAILSDKGLTRNQSAFIDTADPDILAAFALGITSGTTVSADGNFGTFTPNGEFSREQAATMIRNTCKAAGMDTGNVINAGFEDIGSAYVWAVDSINYVRNAGIMSGTSTTPMLFSPKSTYTREQSIVTFNNIK